MQKCNRCGSDYSGNSMGGPNFCPACDCGYSVERAREMNRPMAFSCQSCTDKDAHISQLEAQLREREAECVAHDEMNGVLAAILGNDDTLDEVAFRMRTRAESAESALAALTDRANDNAILASQAIDAKSKAESALAAAREENERLQKAWSEAEKEWKPHCLPDENCPTYYDGCHCSPATAAHFAEENERLESELAAAREQNARLKSEFAKSRHELMDAALKSRSEGSVERAAAVMIKYEMKIPAKFKGLTWEVLARAVLAAADREGE